MSKRNRHRVAKCLSNEEVFYDTYPAIRYSGLHGYHTTPEVFTQTVHTMNACVGVEIELSFPTDTDGRALFLEQAESNIIWCSQDSSITGAFPMEICTIPLLPGDAIAPSFWKPLTDRLTKLGARSWNNQSTGLHVHVSKNQFYTKRRDPNNDNYEIMCARAIYGMYVQDAPWKRKMFGRGSNTYALANIGGQILKFVQTTLPEAIRSKECVARLIEDAENGASDRKSEFNVRNKNTVEFRCGKGTLNPESIARIAEFCLLFAKYCRTYGDKISQTSQKHFEDFICRHAKKNSPIIKILKNDEE